MCSGVVSFVPMPYTPEGEHHMTLLNKIFTTRTLPQIIFVIDGHGHYEGDKFTLRLQLATALAAAQLGRPCLLGLGILL